MAHILLIAENWPPRIGGIERYLEHLARELSKKHSITVIAPKTVIKPIESRALPATVIVIRKRFFWPLVRPKWLPLFVYMYWYVRRKHVDVVLCGKALFEGLAGYYLQKYFHIPYIVCTYAMEIETWRKRAITARKLSRSLQSADKVLYINNQTRQTLLNINVKEKQLLAVYPG
ncbi:MAG: glycosyltransferase family 4 protein, partial [Acidobacteriota bacterium]